MLKAILFDVGGVLVRSEDHRSRQRLAARLGVPEAEMYHHVFDAPAAIAATLGQVPESAIWDYVRQHFHLDEAGFNTFFVDFWAGDQLDTDLLLFLHRCRPRYKTGFLSNAWDGARRLFTEKYRMMWAVDDAIISAEVGMAKPVPAIYQLAAARLGVQPHEALFLDDVPANIAAAEAVGMTGVVFRNTAQAIAEIQASQNRNTRKAQKKKPKASYCSSVFSGSSVVKSFKDFFYAPLPRSNPCAARRPRRQLR